MIHRQESSIVLDEEELDWLPLVEFVVDQDDDDETLDAVLDELVDEVLDGEDEEELDVLLVVVVFGYTSGRPLSTRSTRCLCPPRCLCPVEVAESELDTFEEELDVVPSPNNW